MKKHELIQKHYNEIVEFALQLSEEYKDYCDGWHDDICIRKNGEIYHTSLINAGVSTEVFNGTAFDVFTVNSNKKMSIEEIKEQLDMNILISESIEMN